MQNLQRILVPTDLSECATNALIYAINLAERVNLHLEILYVISNNDSKTVEDINKAFDRLEHHYLFNRKCVYKFLIRQGNTKEMIEKVVKESRVDLIIMGMIGTGGIQEQPYGSIAADLIDRPPCALLAIPENCNVLTSHKIAVANDNKSPANLPELYVLNFLSEAYKSEVDIFHVTHNSHGATEEPTVKASFEELFKYNIHSYTEVKGDNLLHAIKKYTYENKIDLLAVLHRVKASINKARSVSKQLAFAIKLPLLIIPTK